MATPPGPSCLTDSPLLLPGDAGCRDIFLIDFELAGPNYRGFDLCKLFRTASPGPGTARNRRAFMEAYHRRAAGREPTAADVELLLAEADLFLPLTWMEAGVFFLFASVSDGAQEGRWRGLAEDRLGNYRGAMEEFEANVERYKRAKAEVEAQRP
jgi:thiamine kinase-like enzyme